MPGVGVRAVFEVRDNWYAVRGPHGRLLMVGTYLPKAEMGITTGIVSPEDARVLMVELQNRSRTDPLVGQFEGVGEV